MSEGGGNGQVTWQRVAAAAGAILLLLLGALWSGHESRISALEDDVGDLESVVGGIDSNVRLLLEYFELKPRVQRGHRE